MCDQTENIYKDQDVVWVKFGPVWWPGVVKDVEKEGKAEEVYGGLRTKPIATVQFFDEDKYEFVKNLEHIYHYNCKRKDEFLKKGLDKFRSGAKFMAKFPEDVVKAEELEGGSANILNDPKYGPEKKADYKEIFTPVKSKKGKKVEDLKLRTKLLPLKKRMSMPARLSNTATPRRPLNQSVGEFVCPFCDFSSNLIGATTSHVKYSHSSQRVDYGPSNETPKVPHQARQVKSTIKKRGRPSKSPVKSFKTQEATRKDVNDSEASRTPAHKTSPTLNSPPKKKYTDVLLLDWIDDENSQLLTEPTFEQPGTPISAPLDDKPEIKSPEGDSIGLDNEASAKVTNVSEQGSPENEKRESASCFEFDPDEEEGFLGMSNANTYGRKIPRVIPLKDKTALGMDLEIEELFKRKPGGAQDDGEESDVEGEPQTKKRRGRKPKDKLADKSEKVKSVKKRVEPLKETLASTRERRPAARKSYVNEIISQKMDDEVSNESVDVKEERFTKNQPRAQNSTDKIKDKTVLEETEDSNDENEVETSHFMEITDKVAVSNDKAVVSPEKVDVSSEKVVAPSRKLQISPKKVPDTFIQEVEDNFTTIDELMNSNEVREDNLLTESEGISHNVSNEPEDIEPPKPSRRKQDLKRSSLVELDQLNLPIKVKKPLEVVTKLKGRLQKNISLATSADDDLTAQLESVLAETAVPAIPTTAIVDHLPQTLRTDEEFLQSTVEFLEDEPSVTPPQATTPVKVPPVQVPIKKWKDNIRTAMVTEQTPPSVKKSVLPIWQQGIKEQLKNSTVDSNPPKEVTIEKRVVEPPAKSKIIKVGGQKSGTYYIVNPQSRPQILGKSGAGQQVMLVTSRAGTQQRLKFVTSKPSGSAVVNSSPSKVVQLIQSGHGGTKAVVSNNVFLNTSKSSSPQQLVIKKGGEGLRVIKNLPGKTIIVQDSGSGSSSQVFDLRKKLQGNSPESGPRTQCIIQRSKGADGKFTIQKIMKTVKLVGSVGASGVTKYVSQRRNFVVKRPEPVVTAAATVPEPSVVVESVADVEPSPEVAPEPVVLPTPASPHVVAMPVAQDGQTTYMLVTVDESGNFQAVDSSLLASYNVNTDPGGAGGLYTTASEPIASAYPSSSGQDILAEALANTNVLESEIGPLEMSNVMHDPGMILTPIVQETAMIQKPIMTPLEVPSSVIADTEGLEPPPLPPTPDEDVLMEEEGGLMIAMEGEESEQTDTPQPQQTNDSDVTHQGNYFIEDSQQVTGEEGNTFQSMPLLNEESTASEEPIADQNFPPHTQVNLGENNDMNLPTSTNPDLEPEQNLEMEAAETGCPGSEEKAPAHESCLPYVADESFVLDSEETQVTSTTGDAKDIAVNP